MEEAYKAVGRKIGGEKGAAIAQKVFLVTDIALGFISGGAQDAGLADKLKGAKGVSGQLGIVKDTFKSSKVVTGSQKQLSLLKEEGVSKYLVSSSKSLASGVNNKVKSVKNAVVSIPQKTSDTAKKFIAKTKAIMQPSAGSKQVASYSQKAVDVSKNNINAFTAVENKGSMKMNLQFFAAEKVDKVDDVAKSVGKATDATRERVLKNIAESKKTREASRFGMKGPSDTIVQLKNKQVVKLLEQRGLNPDMARSFGDSFDGPIFARWGKKGEQFIATENSYKDASGIFVTIKSAGSNPTERINNLALPPSNKALIESPVKLGKDQILLEGKVAPQPGWAKEAADGIPRLGGEWQTVTNGGKWSEAVEWEK